MKSIDLFIYVLVCFLIFNLVSKISYKLNLVDIPNLRKRHQAPTAFTGGLILGLIYLISIILFEIEANHLNLTLSFAFLISIVGFLDDKYNLNVGGKLSLQILPVIYLVFIENLSLNHIGDYNYFKLELNTFKIPFTILSILFLINSFNYFDGLDGTLSFTTISAICALYILSTDENDKFFLILITLPLLIFLFFNFSIFNLPKLFLGDGGSLLLGFIISFFLIYLANQKLVHPILLAWSIVIFVFEFLAINIVRFKNKRGIFDAKEDHLHHIVFKNTKSIFQTNLYLFLTNIILFSIGYISFLFIGPLASLILFVSLFFIFLTIRNKIELKVNDN